jgi:YlmC/YmxH family sporulation protein
MDLREKEVVNIRDGARLGCVCDVDIDTCSGRITAIIIYGKCKFMGVFGKSEDIKIYWENIRVIGDDVILVDLDTPQSTVPIGYIQQ